MINACELDGMRSTIAGTLASSIEVHRRTVTIDAQGGQAWAWSLLSTVSGHLSAVPSRADAEGIDAERETNTTTWVATLPALTDVRSTDRLVVGGRTFDVQSVDAPRTWELARRVGLLEVV